MYRQKFCLRRRGIVYGMCVKNNGVHMLKLFLGNEIAMKSRILASWLIGVASLPFKEDSLGGFAMNIVKL